MPWTYFHVRIYNPTLFSVLSHYSTVWILPCFSFGDEHLNCFQDYNMCYSRSPSMPPCAPDSTLVHSRQLLCQSLCQSLCPHGGQCEEYPLYKARYRKVGIWSQSHSRFALEIANMVLPPVSRPHTLSPSWWSLKSFTRGSSLGWTWPFVYVKCPGRAKCVCCAKLNVKERRDH